MENKTKHTPGPWTVKPIKDGFHDGKTFIFGPQLDKSEYRPAPVVLLIEKPCKDKDEHAANLALCAAAPELLAALEYIYDTFHDGDRAEEHDEECPGNDPGCCFCKARAAISKAKGDK